MSSGLMDSSRVGTRVDAINEWFKPLMNKENERGLFGSFYGGRGPKFFYGSVRADFRVCLNA